MHERYVNKAVLWHMESLMITANNHTLDISNIDTVDRIHVSCYDISLTSSPLRGRSEI